MVYRSPPPKTFLGISGLETNDLFEDAGQIFGAKIYTRAIILSDNMEQQN